MDFLEKLKLNKKKTWKKWYEQTTLRYFYLKADKTFRS